MFDIPKRVSLSERAADSIRKAIADDAWKGALPTERRLAEIFEVSRPTIRAALHLLTTEGRLQIGPRRRHLISAPTGGAKPSTGLVCFFTHLPISRWSFTWYHAFADMRARLAVDGFVTEVVVCEGVDLKAMRRKIETYLKQNRVFCCALLSIQFELQRWIATQPVNSLVIGSCDPSIKLPSFEVDMRSACRHAAAVFLRHEHRHLAVFVPDNNRGGDLASVTGFVEGVNRAPARLGAHVAVIRHNETCRMVVEKLTELFEDRDRPTAFLMTAPEYVYTLVCFLLRRGLRIPEDISIITRDPDPSFSLMIPSIAHYDFARQAYGRAFSRLMLKLVREGHLAPKPRLIELEYIAGGSVARHSP